MSSDFLTIYEVADTLGLHHKTIRGFITDGKLKAVKVGKQWRIAKEELNHFIGTTTGFGKEESQESFKLEADNSKIRIVNSNHSDKSLVKNRMNVSAVVDMQEVDKHKYIRISNTLLAVMNSKDVKLEQSTMHIKYDEEASVCKVLLWGSSEYISEMLSILTLLDRDVTSDENSK